MTSTSRAAPVSSLTRASTSRAAGELVDQGQRRPRAGHCRRLWERRRELGANTYRVLVLPTSTTSRIRGDLDVRVPRRSARARASVRRWPWSSRRGRNVQVKLIKMEGRLVRHSRRLIFQLSEVSVPRRLFQGVLDRIGRLSLVPS